MRILSIMFFLIISSSVLGSDFKGNVQLKFPREVNNMETGEREISEPIVDIPNQNQHFGFWSPPDMNLGDWNCEFRRFDYRENLSEVNVYCWMGNRFYEDGNSLGFSPQKIKCGIEKMVELHLISIWSKGGEKFLTIYCIGE